MGALALVVPAVSAQASTTDRAGKTTTLGNSIKSCGPLNLKGVSTAPNSGNPVTSTRLVCIDGALILYGNSSITYANPPASFAAAGKLLFDQTCSSCHGSDANGVSPSGTATIGPNLQGVGTATVDFWVTTGRMPATDVAAVEAERKPPKLNDRQALEVAAYINSLDPSVPAVPTPHLEGANVANGASLFALNCAACHTITGAGDALAFGTNAPSLQNKKVTAQQVAEAVRIGPANMPRFSGNLSDRAGAGHRGLRDDVHSAPDQPRRCRARRRRAGGRGLHRPPARRGGPGPHLLLDRRARVSDDEHETIAHQGADADRHPERSAPRRCGQAPLAGRRHHRRSSSSSAS